MQSLRSKNPDARLKALRALNLMLARSAEADAGESRVLEQVTSLQRRQMLLEHVAAAAQIGIWECELPSQSLTWTSSVYDLFELPRGFRVTRDEALGFYTPDSRQRLEEARTRALRECTDFTIDVELMTALGKSRWMRITASIEHQNQAPIRLFGTKQDITRERTR